MRAGRARPKSRATYDAHAELDPAIDLAILDAQFVFSGRDRRVVYLRLVRGPGVDDQHIVQPDSHGVIADRTNGVRAYGKSHAAGGLERPVSLRQSPETARRTIPHVIESPLTPGRWPGGDRIPPGRRPGVSRTHRLLEEI